MENAGFYDIVKLCKGGLSLKMQAFDASSQDRTFNIEWNVDKIRVPRAYALGMFVNSTLERMYKEGYFRVEPAEQFEKEVADIFFPVTDKVEVVPDDKIVAALTKGNRAEIKRIMEISEVNRSKIVVLARENIGSIPSSMIRDLEKILEVELTIEDEETE